MEQQGFDSLPNEIAILILNYWLQPDVRISDVAKMLSVSKRIRSLILLAVDSASIEFYPSEEHFRKQITFWRNCPLLKSLTVFGPVQYLDTTEESLKLISQLTTIESIRFEHCLKVSEDTWQKLLQRSQIRSLWLTDIQDETEAFTLIQSNLPLLTHLTSLTITQSPMLGVATISLLTNLKQLNFHNLGSMTIEEWRESETGTYPWHKISKLTNLEDLELNCFEWNNDLTDVLLTMTNLTRLTLDVKSDKDEEFFEALPRLTSLQHLILDNYRTLSKSRGDVLESHPRLTYVALTAWRVDLTEIDDSSEHDALRRKLYVRNPCSNKTS